MSRVSLFGLLNKKLTRGLVGYPPSRLVLVVATRQSFLFFGWSVVPVVARITHEHGFFFLSSATGGLGREEYYLVSNLDGLKVPMHSVRRRYIQLDFYVALLMLKSHRFNLNILK